MIVRAVLLTEPIPELFLLRTQSPEMSSGPGFLQCFVPVQVCRKREEECASRSGLFADAWHLICLSLCSSWSSSLDARGVYVLRDVSPLNL